jgi:hypothetical protein
MKPTIRFVVLTALRDRLFASLLGLLVLVFGVSLYLGGGAVFEKGEMAVAFGAGGARLALVLGLTVFVAFHVERIYETREIEAILARSISRARFIVSYWAGMVVVASLLALPVLLFVGAFSLSATGTAWWCASFVFECCVIVAFALFAAITLERAIPTIFATLGFYGLARLTGFILGIATHGTQGGLNRIANPIIEGISMFLPRLDLYCQTRWLIYGPDANEKLHLLPVQAVIFVGFILAMTIFDLSRKQF